MKTTTAAEFASIELQSITIGVAEPWPSGVSERHKLRCRKWAALAGDAATPTTAPRRTGSNSNCFSRFTPHFLLLSSIFILPSTFPCAAQTWITNSLTISETNTNYDGLDLVISGTGVTVALDGPHAFNSLLLTNGAVLTHSPCTASQTHKLDLTVSNAVVVSMNSRIDASGKGYLPGRTTGNTTLGASTGGSGGSYGGLSQSGRGVANLTYGYYADPDDWGSGGGAD